MTNKPKILKYLEYTHKLTGYINVTLLELDITGLISSLVLVTLLEMPTEADSLLTEGLAEGYAGVKKPELIQRAGFSGKANDFIDTDGHYHDEWFADDNGGGQELVELGDEKATRLYAGGVIPAEELQKLDLTTKDVITQLRISIREMKGKTRLHESCSLELSNGWLYRYEILKKSEEVPLTIGYESISYHGREVFAHGHMISPVK